MSKRSPGKHPERDSLLRRFGKWCHTSRAKCALITFVCGLILFGLFFLGSVPEQYNLTAGTISRYTIAATKDVVDEVATEEKRNAAAAAVEPTYRLEEGASEQVLTDLSSVFNELRTIQQYGTTLRSPDDPPAVLRMRSFSDAELQYAETLSETMNLTRYQITTLLRTSTADYDDMVSTVTTAVENALNTTVREGQEKQAISTISQIVGYKVETSLFQNILPSVLKYCIHPNMVVDLETTEAARAAARETVEPVTYQQGQTIVLEGERVTPAQISVLRTLGLLDDDIIDISVYIGGAIMILMIMILQVLLIRIVNPSLLHDIRRTFVVNTVLIITTALCVLAIRVINVFLAPVALAAILLTVLINWQTGVAGAITMSLLSAVLIAGGSSSSTSSIVIMMITGLMGSLFSVFVLSFKPRRLRVIFCGLLIALVGIAIQIALNLTSSASNLDSILDSSMWAISGGLFTGVAAIGLQPLFEALFNLPTPTKLMELGNQNHPLLRRLMMEAPGTYHHSMIVANLAEAAATRIGANAILARTGSYFHDVGKLKRPMYFKENQIGMDNPLDQNDPYVSAAIITSHTKDGLQLAQKYHLPREIQQIIVEHHGDTPVMFFYHKALQMADGNPVDIADFRYDGTCPSSKEAAIVMLSDTIEAAVRSMKDPTPEAIEQNIERLVRGKLEDGQLSNSPLTLRDIDGICEAFGTVLKGVFHERIEYPKENLPKRGLHPEGAEPQKEPAEAPAPAAELPEQKPEGIPLSPDTVIPETVMQLEPEPTPAVESIPLPEPIQEIPVPEPVTEQPIPEPEMPEKQPLAKEE